MKVNIKRTVVQEAILDLPHIKNAEDIPYMTIERMARDHAELLDWEITDSDDYHAEALDDV